MKSTRSKALGALLIAGALALGACSNGAGDGNGNGSTGSGDDSGGESEVTLTEAGFALRTPAASPGGTVTVLGAVDFSHLDPTMGNDGNVNNFYHLIYRHLTNYVYDPETEEMTLVGDLAEDLGTSNEDATVWTFTLREGLRYEDGTPITSHDLKYALERSMDPGLAIGSDLHMVIDGAREYAGIYDAPEGLDSISTPDDRTIEFTLERPLADFNAVAANPPFTPFPDGEVDVEQIDVQPIASGPYRVESYERGSHVSLVRNEEWDPETDPIRAAQPDAFEFVFGLDPNTIDQRALTGQGDDRNAVISSTNPLLPASLGRVLDDETLRERTIQILPTCTTFLTLNTTKDVMSDLTVRQALNYAIDRQSVITATGGPAVAEVATEMLLPTVPGREEFDLYPTDNSEGDPELARSMIEEAGYDVDELSFVMDVRGIPKWQAQAEAVQQSLQAAGISVELNVIDGATYYEAIGTPAQQNDMAIYGWCGSWLSGTPLLTPLFDGTRISESGNTNMSQFDEPEINDRFREIEMITDIDEQNAAYAELNREIMEHAPVVPLVRETPLQMVGENVGDAYAHAARTGYIDYASVGLIDPEG
ncbi:ABC transporter substrate-binding protein [Pseudactinotalea sp. Z1739]|uniref:ABC transporter substrate-binding protein n=1 Tax=Pseudactinotalea sp. Z1739 TaxID=3413028 RepID=UPI003C7E2353